MVLIFGPGKAVDEPEENQPLAEKEKKHILIQPLPTPLEVSHAKRLGTINSPCSLWNRRREPHFGCSTSPPLAHCAHRKDSPGLLLRGGVGAGAGGGLG